MVKTDCANRRHPLLVKTNVSPVIRCMPWMAAALLTACGGGGNEPAAPVVKATEATATVQAPTASSPTTSASTTSAPSASALASATDAVVRTDINYRVVNTCGNKVLSVSEAGTFSGAAVLTKTDTQQPSQRWRFEVAADGDYVLRPAHANQLALDLRYSDPTPGNLIHAWQTNGTNAQRWQIVAGAEAGTVQLRSRVDLGSALDVRWSSADDGAVVHIWPLNASCAQQWRLEADVGTIEPPPPPPPPPPPVSSLYGENLKKIRAASVRNTNLDNSKYLNTPMASINTADLLGPREDYIRGDDGKVPGAPGGNPEEGFPAQGVGTFRISCEFSHFAYDDPLVHPNKPGAAHLHMFWGNTDVNAYSTYDTLFNSGSSTCNGMELNRSGYWAPAMFDAKGNVRVPERIIVYYKGYGLANGASQVFPPRAAMVNNDRVHRAAVGGAIGEPNFLCSNQYRGERQKLGLTIPNCTDGPFRRTLEMHVKFGNCWNRNDPSNPDNWELPKQGGWFNSDCQPGVTTPNIHYIIAYPLEDGENTEGWYLSSDVSPVDFQRNPVPGSSIHADWWGGWHPDINKQFIDNCVNYKGVGVDHGCGFGYLTDGGPDGLKPYPGPALKYRQQYTGPIKVPASTLFRELCDASQTLSTPQRAALCRPAEMRLAAATKGSVCTAKDGTNVAAAPGRSAIKLVSATSPSSKFQQR
jgi:Domain of unknown function (DUF1996)/Ricin-type beta-trefoil lectin domain-like